MFSGCQHFIKIAGITDYLIIWRRVGMRVYMERVLTAVTLNLITEYQYLHNDAYYHSYGIHSLASLRGSNSSTVQFQRACTCAYNYSTRWSEQWNTERILACGGTLIVVPGCWVQAECRIRWTYGRDLVPLPWKGKHPFWNGHVLWPRLLTFWLLGKAPSQLFYSSS